MNFFSTSLTKRTTTGTFSTCFIPPQNGVVEGSVYYGSGNESPLMARASSIDTQNGNVAGSDTPARPKILEVNSLSKNAPHRGFATKNILDDIGDNDDGSLPCTPELFDGDMASCTAGDEVLENDTRELIGTFLTDFTGLSTSRWRRGKTLSTMKRVVESLLEKHRYSYNGMINKLELDKRENDMSFIMSVAKSLFGDGVTNWGRVASLVAFGAVVCQYLKEIGRQHCVELVGQEISTYLLSDQRDWLVKNNSWDGFVEFFQVADPESTVRNTLMAVAGFAGIGATLALLIR